MHEDLSQRKHKEVLKKVDDQIRADKELIGSGKKLALQIYGEDRRKSLRSMTKPMSGENTTKSTAKSIHSKKSRSTNYKWTSSK